jgi:hypothetical protein
MKRCLATLLVFAVCSAVVRADVTIVQSRTMEGAAAAMGGGNMAPKTTIRIKGMKSRSDVELPINTSVITDLVLKQVFLLRHDQKTAQITSAGAPATTTAAAKPPAMSPDGAVTATGRSQVIDGVKCDEYTFTTQLAMAEMTGSQMPPEAAQMLRDLTLVMKVSTWVAKDMPGAAEYITFQKALARSDFAASGLGIPPGVKVPGMETVLKALSSVDGLAYLTVMDLAVEGGSGQMADMMRQMGAMKITTKVTSISTDPVADDLFKVPEGYAISK